MIDVSSDFLRDPQRSASRLSSGFVVGSIPFVTYFPGLLVLGVSRRWVSARIHVEYTENVTSEPRILFRVASYSKSNHGTLNTEWGAPRLLMTSR